MYIEVELLLIGTTVAFEAFFDELRCHLCWLQARLCGACTSKAQDLSEMLGYRAQIAEGDEQEVSRGQYKVLNQSLQEANHQVC
jgi:hypothetical protein